MSETKTLISNLKKEIEKTREELEELDKSQIDTPYHREILVDYETLEAQLQFAGKLIEAIKEDVKNIGGFRCGFMETDLCDRIDKEELNKILDKAIEDGK